MGTLIFGEDEHENEHEDQPIQPGTLTHPWGCICGMMANSLWANSLAFQYQIKVMPSALVCA
eukprot:3584831-Karenia_brevis.AAC.1